MMVKFMIFTFLLVSAYNIDTNYPILYSNSATNADQYLDMRFERSYYGYSVLLHHDSKNNISWVLIGAPRGNYTRSLRASLVSKPLNEPGVVYRCVVPGSCVEIKPAIINDEEIYIQQLNMRAHIKKEHSWFGSAMSIERNGTFLSICAPRMIMSITVNSKTNEHIDTMQGICYSNHMSSITLKTEVSDIEHFCKPSWYNPIHGFAITFATLQGQEAEARINRIIGRPNDDITGSVSVTRFMRHNFLENSIKTTDIPIYDDESQFGYAVTSGYYFNRNQSLYACADPGWNYVGQVAIISTYDSNGADFKMIANIHGSDIGEFFGASLATGDLNKDGLHDLVVGAPHWGNDNGRIHIYLGSPRKEFDTAVILEGANEDAQFGYVVASGDLDGDGFSDIIVGAPWEESGVIYIYNGDAKLKDKVKPIVSQRIAMRSNHNLLVKGIDVQTFGFSISEPIDIDNNGYADIAVGAYKSGHVMILRSKPVVKTNLAIYTIPSTLQRNISNFLIKACVEYHHYDTANTHAFKISLIIDYKYKRTKKTLMDMFSTNPPIHKCVSASIALSDNIQDFIEPIAIYASHDFTYNNSSEFCKTCPIESRGNKFKNAQALLSFDIGCGEDKICNSNISAIMKFLGVRENNSWIIGSDDIILETHLQNYAEPAYLTTIIFTLPNDILLRSILPFCEEDADGDILMVICNIGNPLGTNEQKIIKLDLDMRHLTNGSLHGQVLEFSMEIRTLSVNHGMHTIKSLLILQSEASLLLNGKAIEKSYYLSNLDNDQLNITFQHVYQILKFGATMIEKAQLIINIPTAMNDSDSLIFLYKPRIYVSGKYYDCTTNGINTVDIKQNGFQGEISSDASDLYTYHLNNNETLQNAMHDIFKRNVNNHTAITARILQKMYDTKTVKLEDTKKTNNLTIRENDTVYLNCSTYGVNCSKVFCNLSALKTQQDASKLVMRLIFNATKLKDNFELMPGETRVVKFSTDAYVKIINPANRIFGDIRRNINLMTEFHSTAKTQKLQLWIVLVSISFGLILLCVVIIILSMIGFFKRKTKEELSVLKTNEITEDVNKIEMTNTSKRISCVST